LKVNSGAFGIAIVFLKFKVKGKIFILTAIHAEKEQDREKKYTEYKIFKKLFADENKIEVKVLK